MSTAAVRAEPAAVKAFVNAIIDKPKPGRPKGAKNREGHRAGRPRKPAETFAPSIWSAGRAEISVEQRHFDEALRANSSHCAIAFAIRDAVPDARRIAVDLQTIRWTCSKRGVRYCFLTPAVAQHNVIIPFDQGDLDNCKPVTFRMKPAFVSKSGAKRRHCPDPEQLADAKLKVAGEQPHLAGSPPEQELAQNWKPRSADPWGSKDAESAISRPAVKPRRQKRVKISATKPDGSIPTTLGGKLPPQSVLARREWGLRALRR
jgi:hypothetical protein